MFLQALEPEFWTLVAKDARLETVIDDLGITEGCIWHPAHQYLIFSDLTASIVYRWSEGAGLSVIRQPSNITNGNFIDHEGRVLCCEHTTNAVSRIEAGSRHITILVDRWQGMPLNSPNDIVVDRAGRIWFTDPTYGRTSPRVGIIRPKDLDFQGVYRIDVDGTLALVADDYLQPNGLCFSPDETLLYVNDTDRGHIRRYQVDAGGNLSGGAVFAALDGELPGKPDGMKVDTAGNIYCTGPGGVHIFSSLGTKLGVIHADEVARNLCFGGEDGRDLYLAVTGAILRLRLSATGVLPFPSNPPAPRSSRLIAAPCAP